MRLRRLFPLILILLFGGWLRFHALAQDARFHPDEALFATFARKAAVNGDWLLHGPLDKTPLSIYAAAVSMMLVGVQPLPNGVLTLDLHAGEFAARLPGTLASILLAAVVYAAVKAWYRPGSRNFTAPIALFLAAASPYAIAFSATVFTDGLMLLCVMLALWMSARGRWFWAGFWLVIGFGCKQQALFYLPLALVIGWLVSRDTNRELSFRRLLIFAAPIVIGMVLLAAWDSARAEETGVWALASENNDPGGFVSVEELIPRLLTWAGYIGAMAGSSWLTAMLVTLALLAVGFRLKDRRNRCVTIDTILLLYCLGYFVFHWIVAFPTHDRYPLLILPLILILVARGLDWVWNGFIRVKFVFSCGGFATLPPYRVPLLFVLAGILFFPVAWDAAERRMNVGGDRGEQKGIDRVSAYLDAKPLGTIIYDHWLGWELGYYLGTWSDKRLTYYPNPVALADDAYAQPDPAPRYFIVPIDAPADAWLEALEHVGFQVTRDFQTERQVVYRLTRKRLSAGL